MYSEDLVRVAAGCGSGGKNHRCLPGSEVVYSLWNRGLNQVRGRLSRARRGCAEKRVVLLDGEICLRYSRPRTPRFGVAEGPREKSLDVATFVDRWEWVARAVGGAGSGRDGSDRVFREGCSARRSKGRT